MSSDMAPRATDVPASSAADAPAPPAADVPARPGDPVLGVPPGAYARTARTTLQRRPQRGAYDRETVHAILDEGIYCHLGFVVDGQPFVLPTVHARDGETVFVHGAAASRMLGALAEGAPVCLTVTLLDGLVLARSAFHHSMNYRSVVVLGRAREVRDPAEKRRALEVIVEHVARGRSREARGPNEKELLATRVLALPLEEVSAKIRTGAPIDDEEDHALPVWAGEIPLRLVAQAPVPDPRLRPTIEPSEVVTAWRR
jgi:nitroimidazol reductase NimA-like FMN-containing flavoprotein (pyridoxamine 5'-phosphate oxidase superfamily)